MKPAADEARACVTSPSQDARRRLVSVCGDPLFVADWDRVVMMHYEVDPKPLQAQVPFPLDLHEGRGWVSLVSFTMCGLRPRVGGRWSAWLFRPIATHDFLNVRTYVKVNGEPGIHFLAEWLSNRWAVLLGPSCFALPYRLGRIRYDRDWRHSVLRGDVQDSRNGAALHYEVAANSGTTFAPCRAGSLDAWLMERYSAFNSAWNRRLFFRVWHEPWMQRPAQAEIQEDSLIGARWDWMKKARLRGAHISPGVKGVWMGRPRPARRAG